MAEKSGREDEEEEIESVEGEETETEDPEATKTEEEVEETESEDEVVVSLGEESPPQEEEAESAPEWVKNLRSKTKDQQRKIRELEQKLAEQKPPETEVKLGPKPTLADDDVEYDEEKFEAKLDSWKAAKVNHDEIKRKQTEAVEVEKKAYETKYQAYTEQKTALKLKDFDDAESEVSHTLTPMQQSILVKYATNSATLVYALGKNPEQAKKLASIQDPIKFALAARELESKVKVTTRNPKPAPDTIVRGNAPASGRTDAHLAALEKKADATGDRSELIRYKAKLKGTKP